MLRDLYAAIADKLISLMGSALAVVNFVRIAWQCNMGQFGRPLTVSNNENKCAGEKIAIPVKLEAGTAKGTQHNELTGSYRSLMA